MTERVKEFGLFRTANNILSNIILFAAEMIISLWYTPYLVRKIGSELFGFVPLANSLTGFMGILTYALNISTGRYITIELEKDQQERANQVFNTTLIGSTLLVSLALPVGAVLALLSPVLFNVPDGAERQVRILFFCVLAGFFLTVLGINFRVATFARNRFDLRNIVTFIARLGQIGLIVLLFTVDRPKLAYVGLGALTAALLGFFGDFALWKRLLPALKFRLSSFRKGNLDLLFRTGGWTMVYQVGFILFVHTDMLVANRVLDLSLAGMYGALLVIPKNLRVLSMAIGGVWGPPLLARYSRSDYAGMDEILRLSIKVIGYVMALPVGLVCGLAAPFLTIWLGAQFSQMQPVLILMSFHLASNLIVGPFFNVQIALNKLHFPALMACALGIVNLALSIFLSGYMGALGIALAGALSISAYYSLFAPLYTARILKLPWYHYLVRLLPIYAAGLGAAFASFFISQAFSMRSLIHLAVACLLVSALYLVFVYLLALSKIEKAMVQTMVFRTIGGRS